MSAENVLAGWEGYALINGTNFAITNCSLTISRSTFNKRDSQSGRRNKSGVDGEVMRVSFQFQVASDVNPFTAPLNVMDPDTDTVEIAIYWRGEDFDAITGTFTLTEFQPASFSAQSGPISGSLAGESYGDFIIPED